MALTIQSGARINSLFWIKSLDPQVPEEEASTQKVLADLEPYLKGIEVPFTMMTPKSGADDLPLNFHPTALRASAGFYAVGRGWSNVRSAERVGVAQPIARCGEIGGIGCRREVAQRRVRPPLVVIVDPVRNP